MRTHLLLRPTGVPRLGLLALVMTLVLSACATSKPRVEPTATGAAGPFLFVDDRGKQVSLPKRPQRIVAYSSAAAALWDFGVRNSLVGVFGPQKGAAGKKDPQIGELDLGRVQSVGVQFGDFDVERFASLKPDLLVSTTYGAGGTLWYVQEEAVGKVEAIAPAVAIKLQKQRPLDVIARFAGLAEALGYDPDSPAVARAREDFEKAEGELREAARAKPGLKVLALTGGKDQVFMAKPGDFGDLQYFRDLGLDVVQPEGADEFFELLSWEQADKYPADLILYDDRSSFWLTPEQMAEFPTWNQLPAVKAGQLHPWRVEPPFSYHSYAKVLRDLAEAVNRADPNIVP